MILGSAWIKKIKRGIMKLEKIASLVMTGFKQTNGDGFDNHHIFYYTINIPLI